MPSRNHSFGVVQFTLSAAIGWVLVGAVTACGGENTATNASTTGGTNGSTFGGSGGIAPATTAGGALGGSGGKVPGTTGSSVLPLGGRGGATSGSAAGGTSTAGVATGGSTALATGTQALITSYVTPYCARLAQCCTAAGYVAPTTASCTERELGFYGKSVNDGSALVNTAGVSALLGAIQSTCDQPSYTLFSNLTAGTRPIGSECTDVSQCAGDSVMCQILGSATVGKCVALGRGKAGDACAVNCDNTSTCQWTVMGAGPGVAACWDEDGLRCSDTGVCVALTGIGKTCDSSSCGAHADCNGVCRARGKLGESCSDGRSCESTLICDSKSYTCVKMSIAWSGSCGT
jgi:hypothetical protein